MSLTKQAEPLLHSAMAQTGEDARTEQLSVERVPVELMPHVFALFGKQIDRALQHGAGDSTTKEHMLAACLSGDVICWVIRKEKPLGIVLLAVRQFKNKVALTVELAAGSRMGEWLRDIEDLLREFKSLVGADCIEATCRDGMAKRLSGSWKRKATLMEMI